MSLSLTAFFNLRLARIEQIGYHRCVQFFDLAGAPLPTQVASGDAVVPREERSGRPLKQRRVLVEDCELTEEQLRKRQKNLRYRAKLAKRRSPAFFQQAKAQLSMLMIMEES
jgi:hypothetical protein